jgi:hypothetical protein
MRLQFILNIATIHSSIVLPPLVPVALDLYLIKVRIVPPLPH